MNWLLVAAFVTVIDGDTLNFDGERVRLLDIDTPEISDPRCEKELLLGLEAKQHLQELLAYGEATIERHGQDRYGRTLAHVYVNGSDVGQQMLDQGYAIRWRPGRQAWAQRAEHWCGGGS